MSGFQKKLCVGGIVLAGALGYLVYAGIQSGSSYYLEVASFLADARYQDQRVRLRGTVGHENLVRDDEGRSVRFELLGLDCKLPVYYEGTIPDLFEAGGEVVAVGRLGPDRVFQAEELLTKCASKYESRPDGMKKESL